MSEGGSDWKVEVGIERSGKSEFGRWKEKITGYGIRVSDTVSQLSSCEFLDTV